MIGELCINRGRVFVVLYKVLIIIPEPSPGAEERSPTREMVPDIDAPVGVRLGGFGKAVTPSPHPPV